jgi:hypothetical protein
MTPPHEVKCSTAPDRKYDSPRVRDREETEDAKTCESRMSGAPSRVAWIRAHPRLRPAGIGRTRAAGTADSWACAIGQSSVGLTRQWPNGLQRTVAVLRLSLVISPCNVRPSSVVNSTRMPTVNWASSGELPRGTHQPQALDDAAVEAEELIFREPREIDGHGRCYSTKSGADATAFGGPSNKPTFRSATRTARRSSVSVGHPPRPPWRTKLGE